MSKIAKRIINLPTGVEMQLQAGKLKFSGPKGLSKELIVSPEIKIEQKGNQITTTSSSNIALAGTYNALLHNMIKGVVDGFRRVLEVKGVGYKAQLANDGRLTLELGKSHPDFVVIPSEVKVVVDKSQKVITISGLDNEHVNSFAALVRSLKRPGVYHEKGLYYQGEKIRLKPTKSVSK